MHKHNQTQGRISLRQKILLLFFGFLLTIIILEIGLRLGGFIISSLQEHKNRLSLQKKSTYRIICLGESTTQNQYPPFLEESLNQRNIGIKFSVIDKGIVGALTGIIVSQLEANLDKYQPDLVVTMIGINDRGVHIPYEVASTSRIILFFKSFRTYKLTRLLWLHLTTKAKEIGLYNPEKSSYFMQRLSHNLPKNSLKTAYVEQDNLAQQDETFKKATELSPKNYQAYVELGNFYRDQGRLIEVGQSFKKAIELNPKNDQAYMELGWCYRNQGKLTEAEQCCKKAIELNPKNDWAYIELGWCYRNQGRLTEAEQSFKKAIELNPKNDQAYVELGGFYIFQGKFSEAEQSFKKAIELNPKSDWAYIELGWCYRNQGRLIEVEQVYKKAIELNPKSDWAYTDLGSVYIFEGKFSEAEQVYKKAIELNPKNDWAYGGLATLYNEMGKYKFLKEYGEKADRIRKEYYNPITINNYHRLQQILERRKVRLVCVQYPMRSIEPLKKIFKGQEGIILVDNEKSFQDAVRKASYKDYFTDIFAGDFGHCTEKGNRLLAENIANVILREIFNR